ncbi:signal peptidase I [Nocardioides sp. CFH 31398]|uniref:signal peptidase I n=1 Tax=Nocardioides sp. CFH 31398 TaxID=2919579 RepID=UPI001F068F2A|nr:signal peptidase I [Nocardioides sp. CFH 31398]MCH1868674.1 signal peptidase I [Nocardioides sp. CFH 31398]
MTTHDRGADPVEEPVERDPADEPGRDLDDAPEVSRRRRRGLRLWQETGLLLALALVLALVIKTFFLQAFYIPSESMEPGLVKNDRILVQKVSYWGSAAPQRGDVVVFEDPGGWLDEPAATDEGFWTSALTRIGLYPTGGHLVKRVIGVEGDVIECCEEGTGRLIVNGEPIDEKAYTKPGSTRTSSGERCAGPMTGSCRWTAGPVPEGDIFVMGDNRNRSADSTVHMCAQNATDCTPGREFVGTDLVVGKVFTVVYPFDNFRWVERPDAFENVPPGQ